MLKLYYDIYIYTRVGDNSGRVFFEFPRCMSLARYSIRYFVIRYKNIGILDIFENLDFLKKYIYIYGHFFSKELRINITLVYIVPTLQHVAALIEKL